MCVCAGVCADWTEWLYMHFFFWFIGGRLMKFTTLACADAKEKNETFSAHTTTTMTTTTTIIHSSLLRSCRAASLDRPLSI
jgi:hypothetical protein